MLVYINEILAPLESSAGGISFDVCTRFQCIIKEPISILNRWLSEEFEYKCECYTDITEIRYICTQEKYNFDFVN